MRAAVASTAEIKSCMEISYHFKYTAVPFTFFPYISQFIPRVVERSNKVSNVRCKKLKQPEFNINVLLILMNEII